MAWLYRLRGIGEGYTCWGYRAQVEGVSLARYWGHPRSHAHTHHTLTDTYTPELAQPYVYIWRYTHTPPALHWLAQHPPPLSILNSKARQPLAEGSGNPPGSWGWGWPWGGRGVGKQGHLFSMHIS